MKLSQISTAKISESLLGIKMREALMSNNYFNRQQVNLPSSDGQAGIDNPPENAASTAPTGIPAKPRHRKFLGMEQRPGSIRI